MIKALVSNFSIWNQGNNSTRGVPSTLIIISGKETRQRRLFILWREMIVSVPLLLQHVMMLSELVLSPMYLTLSVIAVASRYCTIYGSSGDAAGGGGGGGDRGGGTGSTSSDGDIGSSGKLEQQGDEKDSKGDRGGGGLSSSYSSNNSNTNNLTSVLTNLLKTMSSHGKTAIVVPLPTMTTSMTVSEKKSSVRENSNTSTSTIPTISSSSTTLFRFQKHSFFFYWYCIITQRMWVPKSWFQHFYVFGLFSLLLWTMVVVVVEVSSLSWTTTEQVSVTNRSCRSSSITSSKYYLSEHLVDRSTYIILPTVLLVIHLIRRTYECHHTYHHNRQRFQQQQQHQSLNHQQQSKMHVAGYLLGMIHYFVLPLCFLPTTTPSDLFNNSHNIVGLVTDNSDDNHHEGEDDTSMAATEKRTTMTAATTTTSDSSSVLLIILTLVFLSVMNLWLQYEQYQHHMILAELRHGSTTHPKEHRHQSVHQHEQKPSNNSNTVPPPPPSPSPPDGENSHSFYKIPPRKRWFKYVWCPHYLAEVLLYLTFAIMIEFSIYIDQQQQQYQYHHHRDESCQWDENTDTNNGTCGFYQSKFIVIQTLMLRLLGIGRRFRHWTLFVWIATNLTVSALNNTDWYHRKLILLLLEEEKQKTMEEKLHNKNQQHDECSTTTFVDHGHRWAIIPFVV